MTDILTELRFRDQHTATIKAPVTNTEFKTIQLTRHDVCPQWNYTIRPRPKNTE